MGVAELVRQYVASADIVSMVVRSLVAALLGSDFLGDRPLWGLVQASERCHAVARLLMRLLKQVIAAGDLLDLNRGVLLLSSLRLGHLALEHIDVVLEALESDEDDGEIVERAILGRGVKDLVRDLAADGVDRGRLARGEGLLASLGRHVPDDAIDLVVLELVEYAVTANERIVQVKRACLLVRDFSLAAHDALLAAQVLKLGLAVAKRAADREAPGEDSVRAHERVVLVVAVFGRWARLLPDLLRLRRWHAFVHDCLGLVHMATRRLNPRELPRIRRLVVPREDPYLALRLHAHLRH